MLVPKDPPMEDNLPPAPAMPGAGGFLPPLPIFPFGAGFMPAFPPVAPGMPVEVGGTTFFNSPAPAALDPLSLLPSHDPVAIMKQVEWYFQPDNLQTDIFLRTSMDERGYVPVEIIASFNRLKAHGITKDEILLCCRPSTVVKVKGDKIKCRDLWYTWVLPGDKVKSIVASDDEDAGSPEADPPATNDAPGPDKTVTSQVLTASEFFNIFKQ